MDYRKIAALLLTLCLLAGCARQGAQTETPKDDQAQTEQSAPQPQESAKTEPAENTSQVADASQMTTVEDVERADMVPVLADELVDGTYSVAVDCSSSMFKIADCALTVADGAMTAKLTMSSTSYGYLYPGSAEAAAAADASARIAAVEENGASTFVVPVEALDKGVSCAAWSRNKELWYDRTLVFRSDSLPLEAFKNLTTAASLGLADGAYTAEATLAGGSGRASVESPAQLTVAGGKATARLVWSSANYDYMIVDGEKYLSEIVDGHSVFLIPVAAFDRPLGVIADTTAMSQPHEVEYTLTFAAATIPAAQQ